MQINRIKGMQKLRLGCRLVGQEMNIIDRQQVETAQSTSEISNSVFLQGVDVLVGELFR